MGWVLLGAGWPGLMVGQNVDMEEVRRRAEKYEREAAEEAAKKAPAPKLQPKPAPAPKPQPKPAPAVDHDREAWQSAEKCGTAACFEAYLEDYPKGRYARMARARLKAESESQTPAATALVAKPSKAPVMEEQLRLSVVRHAALIKQRVERYWSLPPDSSGNLSCTLRITATLSGTVTSVKIAESSGDVAFDDSAVLAAQQASPLPIPADPQILAKFLAFNLLFKPGG
ncbi:MAG: energy transducer TonB [Candidatus Contendobacter sp.]|nr:energy transducer TonB [Candidatus Contendobacter sp.]